MSGSFAYSHFQFYNIDGGFFLALWAIKGNVDQYTVFIDFGSGLAAANWAWNPQGWTFCLLHDNASIKSTAFVVWLLDNYRIVELGLHHFMRNCENNNITSNNMKKSEGHS